MYLVSSQSPQSVLEYFHHLPKVVCLWEVLHHIAVNLPALGCHWATSCLYRFFYSGQLTKVDLFNMWLSVIFLNVRYILFEKHKWHRRTEKERSSLCGFTPQMVAMSEPGAWDSIWISQVGTGTQALEPSSLAFAGALAESWIRSRVARAQTGTPLWDTGIIGANLTCSTVMLACIGNFVSWLLSTVSSNALSCEMDQCFSPFSCLVITHCVRMLTFVYLLVICEQLGFLLPFDCSE